MPAVTSRLGGNVRVTPGPGAGEVLEDSFLVIGLRAWGFFGP